MTNQTQRWAKKNKLVFVGVYLCADAHRRLLDQKRVTGLSKTKLAAAILERALLRRRSPSK